MFFIVVDIEIVLINDIYVFYVVGFLVVEFGDVLFLERFYSIEMYFSEDYLV